MNSPLQGLGHKMAKGAAWMVLFKLVQRVIGFVSTLLLARLLVPADFGLIAMAMSVFAILEVMSSFSFDLALIQNQRAERKHYDTVWTYNVLFGLANAIIMAALAIPVALFFSEMRVEWIMYALALCALISGFENIGVVAFQKELELHKEFYFGLAKKLATFFVTIAVALWLRNFWALLAGMIVGRIVGLVLSYLLHPYRPRFSLAATGELFHFSKWMLINNILLFISSSGINPVIGRMFGSDALGMYSVAYEISNLPTTELVFPITRAVVPGYSILAHDRKALRESFLKVIGLVALLTVPAGAGIGLVAEPLVHVLLGDKWMTSVALVQLLALFGVVRSVHGQPGPVFIALGKPYRLSTLQIIYIGIATPLLIWLVNTYGLVGVPLALLGAISLSLPINYFWLMRELNAPYSRLVNVVWRPFVATAVMCLPVYWITLKWNNINGIGEDVIRLVISILAGTITYVAVILLLWRIARCPDGAERQVLEILRSRISRISG